jgi:phenylacetaldehyde dehydrogenase
MARARSICSRTSFKSPFKKARYPSIIGGQPSPSCCPGSGTISTAAGPRLFVEQSRFDEVVDGVAQVAKSIKVGDGLLPDTQMGPLVSEEQLHRVTGYLDSDRADGAEVVTGGGRIGDRGYFVEPTVITHTRPEMNIVREEIFGPVVVAQPFRDLDEVAAMANDTAYGLAAAVWSRDGAKAHAMAKRLRAGTVWVNCYNIYDAALPFGGYKQSGWGREMGHEVLGQYTEVKSVCAQL